MKLTYEFRDVLGKMTSSNGFSFNNFIRVGVIRHCQLDSSDIGVCLLTFISTIYEI